jgi:L-arabinose isomerase
LATSAESWLVAGAPHHTVLTTALESEVYEDFADMLSVELAVIDASTSVREFRRELQWNDAYHRLTRAGTR